jgi:hypothetical protein
MRNTAIVARLLVRLCGIALIILGILFWTGRALSLVSLHMLLGLVLVVALWVLAGVAARAGVPAGRVVFAAVLGLVVLALGMTQRQLLVGSAHWVIRVLHLLVGLWAMGLGERLARGILERSPATAGRAVA